MSDDVRVVLVKPGDKLLIGNVGELDADNAAQVVSAFNELTGLRVVLFEADIDIALMSDELRKPVTLDG